MLPRHRVNGAGFRNRGISSADEERKRPSADRTGCPVRHLTMTRRRAGLRRLRLGSSVHPSAATEELASEQDTAHRLLQSKTETRARSRTTVTSLPARFSREGVALPRRASDTRRLPGWPRAGYPGVPACRPISCRASLVQGTGANSTTESDTLVASPGLIALERAELIPEFAKVRLQPAARTDELSNEPGCLQLQGNPPSFWPAETSVMS